MKTEDCVKIDTITDTKKKFVKKECKNIGKIWERFCPKCNKKLIYYSRRGYYHSNKFIRIEESKFNFDEVVKKIYENINEKQTV